MQANQKSVISTVVIATVLLLFVSAFGFASVNSNLKLVGEKLDGFDVDENAIANAVIANMTIPEYPEFPDYMLSKYQYEKSLIEDEAERLALNEIDSKDFKEAVFDALDEINGEGAGIEDWKDITEIKIMDSDVTDIGETSEVEFEVKVYYFTDGDEDENFRARLKPFIITVDGLVVDDDFEDAEVTDSYVGTLEVDKVY